MKHRFFLLSTFYFLLCTASVPAMDFQPTLKGAASGGGNATVPNDAPILPAQAFVDAAVSFITTGTIDLHTVVVDVDEILGALADSGLEDGTLNVAGSNAAPTTATAAIVVTGAGYEGVNGAYVQTATIHGKPHYDRIGSPYDGVFWYIEWNDGDVRWEIWRLGGAEESSFYASSDDVATPDLTTEWHNVDFILPDPAPTSVTAGMINTDKTLLQTRGWTVTTNSLISPWAWGLISLVLRQRKRALAKRRALKAEMITLAG